MLKKLIFEKKLDEIVPYENNPRINDNAVDAVAASIKNFGFQNPIIIDKDGVIVAGHTRRKAAEKLGLETVPCIVADDLTPEQVKAFRVADNKTAELAEWDFEKLETELADLAEMGFDMDGFGFDNSNLADDTEIIEDEVPEVDEESEPITKRGDIWKLGNHYLMCGDATVKEDVEKLMTAGECAPVSLLLTDPPYNVAYEGRTDEALTIKNDDMPEEEFILFLQQAFENADRHIKPGGAFYIWHSSREQRNFEKAIPWEIRQQLIWIKNSMVLGRQDYQWKHEPCFYGWKDGAAHSWYNDRSQTTVMEFNKPARNGEHPTMKPVELIAYQMQNSTAKGETVLDLFGGSGTTLIAAEQTGRNCRMLELDERYADVIIKRFEALTGEKGILYESGFIAD